MKVGEYLTYTLQRKINLALHAVSEKIPIPGDGAAPVALGTSENIDSDYTGLAVGSDGNINVV